MNKSQRVLAIVPARSGSKGLKNKNILELNGKPLIAWSIESALASNYIDDVILSTDSKEYAEIGQKYGAWVPFLRESALASDTSSLMGVIKSSVKRLLKLGYEYDVVIVLQPTSPLRNKGHIDAALKTFISWNETPKSLASVYQVDSKYRWLLEEDNDGALAFMDKRLNEGRGFTRQSNKPVYMPNGAIFIYQTQFLSSQYQPTTRPFIMSQQSSEDIDTEADFERVKALLSARQ